MRISQKKGQVWSLDIIISFIIFIIGIMIFYKFSVDLSNAQDQKFNSILTDAKSISSLLLSKGYPEDWNTSTVSLIGITNHDKRLNETKLLYFSQLNYNATRSLFGTRYSYYLFFEDKYGKQTFINNITGIGKPGINSSNVIENENPQNIVSIYRYLIYNSSTTRMRLYLWE